MKNFLLYALSLILWRTIGRMSYKKTMFLHGYGDPTTAPMLYKTFVWMQKRKDIFYANEPH